MNEPRVRSAVHDELDLAAVFCTECVETILPGTDKDAVLRQLVSSLVQAGRLPQDRARGVADCLIEREQRGTTAMGNGLAFPHMRTRAVDEFAGAIGVAPHGVDFNSLDRTPTRLIILLLSPFEERERHCEIMGRLATLLSNKTLQYSVQIRRTSESLFRFLDF
jgi:mannitol/fructose-specific phosphotransferase system IIA component (Ntr-type)